MSLTLKPVQSKEEWEHFFLRYGPKALFQSWLWGDIQQKMGLPVWRLGMYDNKTLCGLVQVAKITAKRGNFLHIRHGPVFDTYSPDLWRWFISEMKKRAKTESVWFLRLNPLIENSSENQKLLGSLGLMPAAIHAMDAEYAWVLDIQKDEHELLAGMRKTTRYEIKKAIHSGVRIIKSVNPESMTVFLDLYKKTAKRQGFVEHKGIEEEFRLFAKEAKAMLFTGMHDGKVLAAAIILFVGNQGIYHHSASIPSGTGVNYLLQWEAILEAKKRGCSVYNFWGIAPDNKPNHPWRGITLFKKGFGGRVEEHIHSHDLPVSPLYVIPRTVETLRRLRKGY